MSQSLSSPRGSSVHGIFHTRILEWVATSYPYLLSPGIELTSLASPALADRFFTPSNTWEAQFICGRKWQLTPVFLPGKSLVGYSPWGHKESDMTEWLNQVERLKGKLLNAFIMVNTVWDALISLFTLDSQQKKRLDVDISSFLK